MVKFILGTTVAAAGCPAFDQQVITGRAAFVDWNEQQAVIHRKLAVAVVHTSGPQEAYSLGPRLLPNWADALPVTPISFKASLYAGDELKHTAASSSEKNGPRGYPPRLVPSVCNVLFGPRPTATCSDLSRGAIRSAPCAAQYQMGNSDHLSFRHQTRYSFPDQLVPAEDPTWGYVSNSPAATAPLPTDNPPPFRPWQFSRAIATFLNKSPTPRFSSDPIGRRSRCFSTRAPRAHRNITETLRHRTRIRNYTNLGNGAA